jgi:hypothetical protein
MQALHPLLVIVTVTHRASLSTTQIAEFIHHFNDALASHDLGFLTTDTIEV